MAKQKRKVSMPAGIRNKMIAATSMLMVSCIMMVSSTYAWFTLSTAPEVKNISTTVAGNGSLEIALMPTSGLYKDISSGAGMSIESDDVILTEANTTWGNIVQLNDDKNTYGFANMTLNPAILNVERTESETTNEETGESTSVTTESNTFADVTKPLAIAVYGYDGRVEKTDASTMALKSFDTSGDAQSFSSDSYGVRAIGELNGTKLGSTYGYVVDLAFRLNTKVAATEGTSTATVGKLLLQTEEKQRIYNNADSEQGVSSNAETLGGGSYMSFNANNTGLNLDELIKAVRVTFVQNYGLGKEENQTDDNPTPTILGTAKLDLSTKEPFGSSETKVDLYLYEDVNDDNTKLTGENAVVLSKMTKNAATQVSAIVWLDGSVLRNASVSAIDTAMAQATLNLQFSTDAVLEPANNNALFEGSAE